MNTLTRIIEIIRTSDKSDREGWLNLAYLGNALSVHGINLQERLYQYLERYPNIFQIKTITINPNPPIHYVRIQEETIPLSQPEIIDKLLDWAFFPDFPNLVESLRLIALHEDWSFLNSSENRRNIILIKYLEQTFKRLIKENKVLTRPQFALFNTGLVSKEIQPIYLVFEPNPLNCQQKWLYANYYIPGITPNNFLPDEIDKYLPGKPEYFIDQSQIQYTSDDIRPKLDIDTILREVYRLPLYFFEELTGKNLTTEYNSFIEEDRETSFFQTLAYSIRNDPDLKEKFRHTLHEALHLALLRLEWDVRTVIPVFYPPVDDICFILPAQLTKNNKVDAAFLIQKKENSCTVLSMLELSWAYTNARFIRPVGSDWLNPCKIEIRE